MEIEDNHLDSKMDLKSELPPTPLDNSFPWNHGYFEQDYKLLTYKCDLCNSSFNVLPDLETHISQHLQKRSVCEMCGRGFLRTTDLTRHRRLHTGEKPYLCQYCGEMVIDSSALSKHFQVYHAKVKRHVCTICNKGFVNKKCYESHLKKHIEEKENFYKEKIPRPKIYQCEICSSMFGTRWLLKNHQQIHFGELYECHICSRKFNRRSNLKCHINIHKGIRPYKCDQCDYCCAHGSNLIKHKRRHQMFDLKDIKLEPDGAVCLKEEGNFVEFKYDAYSNESSLNTDYKIDYKQILSDLNL